MGTGMNIDEPSYCYYVRAHRAKTISGKATSMAKGQEK